jgi:hypothetical protein
MFLTAINSQVRFDVHTRNPVLVVLADSTMTVCITFMPISSYDQVLSIGTPNGIIEPYYMECCFDEIVGVTPLDLTVVPLVQSIGDFMLELALPMLFSISCILAQLSKR